MVPRTETIQATPLVRFTLDTGQPLLSASWHQFGGLAVSRDGQRLVWVASDGNGRPALPEEDGLAGDASPSADRGSVESFLLPRRQVDRLLRRPHAEEDLGRGRGTGGPRPRARQPGGCWSDGDEIVFAADAGSGLLRMPAGGGSPRPLTELDASRGELSHRWPSLVAGADVVVFTMKTKGLQSFDDAPIAAVSLKSGERKNVIDGGTGASYSSTGHLVYARGRAPGRALRLVAPGGHRGPVHRARGREPLPGHGQRPLRPLGDRHARCLFPARSTSTTGCWSARTFRAGWRR